MRLDEGFAARLLRESCFDIPQRQEIASSNLTTARARNQDIEWPRGEMRLHGELEQKLPVPRN